MRVESFLRETAARLPDKVVLVCGDEDLSFAELDRLSELRTKVSWHSPGISIDRLGPVCRVAPASRLQAIHRMESRLGSHSS